jgi:DNA adenine methylase
VRLQNVQIECADALRIIRSGIRGVILYCDPPYIGTDMGHYDGYTGDFDALIAVLSG